MRNRSGLEQNHVLRSQGIASFREHDGALHPAEICRLWLQNGHITGCREEPHFGHAGQKGVPGVNTGRIPGRGYEAAVRVARDLGQLMFFTPSPKYPADFLIRGDQYLGLIAIRKSRRIRAVIAEILVRYALAISALRTFPAGGPVSRELWLYSRHGTIRFFRVNGTGIEEIDRRVIFFPEKVPEGPGQNSAVVGGAAGSSTVGARLNAEDNERSLLRWLARRCPEIGGERAPEISGKEIAK
jgi:hypothetical protein